MFLLLFIRYTNIYTDTPKNYKKSEMPLSKYSVNAKIGQRLRQTREDLDLKQKDVAAVMHRDPDFISMSERDKRQISVDDVVAFSQIYKKPIIYFFSDL